MGKRFRLAAAAAGFAVAAIARAPLCAVALAAVILAGSPARAQAPTPAPDTRPSLLPSWVWPTGPATAKHAMIAAAHPLAVEAGLELLRAGGSAADAAIGVQLVLNLVEPQSSGIGGGAFALYWDAAVGQLKSYDGRETAPAAAKPDRFLVGKSPMRLGEAIFGGASVGVPGTVRLLETLHKQHGRLPWARLFEPAIRLAEQGFTVSPRLHLLLRWYGPHSFAARARGLFLRPRRQRPPRRLRAQESRAGGHAARHRRGRRGRLLRGADRRGHRRGRARCSQPPGRRDAGGPCRLPCQGARALVLCVPAQPHLRHGSAVVRRAGRRPDPEAGRALRPGQGAGGRAEPAGVAPDRRGPAPRLRRPRPLRGRPRLRHRAADPARCRPTSAAGAR